MNFLKSIITLTFVFIALIVNAQVLAPVFDVNGKQSGYSNKIDSLITKDSAVATFQNKSVYEFNRDIDNQNLIDTAAQIRSDLSNNINYVRGISDTRDDSLKAAIGQQWLGVGNTATNNNIGNINTIGYKTGVDGGASNVAYYWSPINSMKVGINTEGSNTDDKSTLKLNAEYFTWDANNTKNYSFSTGQKGFSFNGSSLNTYCNPNTTSSLKSKFNNYYVNIGFQENSTTGIGNGGFFISSVIAGKAYADGYSGLLLLDSTNQLTSSANAALRSGTIATVRSDKSLYVKTSIKDDATIIFKRVLLESSTPVYSTHAAATSDSTLESGGVYRLSNGSSDLGSQSYKTRFEKD